MKMRGQLCNEIKGTFVSGHLKDRAKLYRKVRLISLLILCISLLVGCEKNPKQTEEETEVDFDLTSEQYVTLQEAKEQAEKLQGKNVKGFVFPENIVLPDGEKISDVKLTPWYLGGHKEIQTMEREKALEFIEPDMIEVIQNTWGGYDKIDWNSAKKKIFTDKHDEYSWCQQRDKKTGAVCNFDTYGFFSGDSLNDTALKVTSSDKEYNFLWGDTATEEDVYPLVDGEMSVPDAVAYTENLLNANLSKLEDGQFQYKVQHLYAVKNKDTEKYDFNIIIGRVYQGMNLDTIPSFSIRTKGQYHDKIHSGEMITAIMRRRESLSYINMGTELLKTEQETVLDQVISPYWAVSQMNQEMAGTGGMKFDNCGLVYLLMQDNYDAKRKEQGIFSFKGFFCRRVKYGITHCSPSFACIFSSLFLHKVYSCMIFSVSSSERYLSGLQFSHKNSTLVPNNLHTSALLS